MIPSKQNQALILDRLVECYFDWFKWNVNLVTELTWEINFSDLRASVIYLAEFWYLEKVDTWKWNEIYAKITTEWIKHYEEIFSPKKEVEIEPTLKEKISKWTENLNTIKSFWISAMAVLTVFWVSNEMLNGTVKRVTANLLWIEQVQNKPTSKIILDEKEAVKYIERQFKNADKIQCKKISKTEMLCRLTKLDEKKEIVPKEAWVRIFNKETLDKERSILNQEIKVKVEKMPDWVIKMLKM